ncbi:hypothetical protein HMPREF0454_00332 [Hafnia alvei ATCC 51873]|uniref:Uncharacterized protein n=1 Tax=Hafnia alvei ATCC 51873 TaxID=1002364 RepID=G9Y1B6_HAFAL|nr:hypothetical protein HMPREF0454_00332 [Hafnia alvei ATCC 51873]
MTATIVDINTRNDVEADLLYKAVGNTMPQFLSKVGLRDNSGAPDING